MPGRPAHRDHHHRHQRDQYLDRAEYLGLAVQGLRAAGGHHVDDEVLTHMSTAQSESVGLFGTIDIDIDAELAQLDPSGHRSLR